MAWSGLLERKKQAIKYLELNFPKWTRDGWKKLGEEDTWRPIITQINNSNNSKSKKNETLPVVKLGDIFLNFIPQKSDILETENFYKLRELDR